MAMACKATAVRVRNEMSLQRRTTPIFFLDAHKNDAQQTESNLIQLECQFQYAISVPGYVVAFCSSVLSEKQLHDVYEIIRSQVPPSCKCFSIKAKGVIGISDIRQKRINHSGLAAATLLIPKATGLEIKNIPDLDLSYVLSDSKSEIKAILFFANVDFISNVTLNKMFRNSEVPVVGGVVKSFLPKDGNLAYRYLSFSGPNVMVKSFVIKNTTQLEDDFRKSMQINEEKERGEMEQKSKEEVEQKKTNENEKKRFTFALMFSSMNNTNRKRVSIAFKEVFQNVPLLGLVLKKPIGFTYRQETHSTKNQLEIYSDSTSVFLLVTVTYLNPATTVLSSGDNNAPTGTGL